MMLVMILSSPIRHTVTMVKLYWQVINVGKQSGLCRNQKNVSVIETVLFCCIVFTWSPINLRFYLSPDENPAYF